ncbi:hypothetical protein F4821DRAFT_231541 [Hypoxylon rubiginosum]|uniref:Uncharacterized protein n=1 Tax=Hypoxylon rubiginosum TaxID=110542 RepID=A0ACC0D9T4_9PEZI|nr:hypothetical protein F4821DRAFT_231541 [Hypoxylon rubiginosum]
MVLNMSLSNEAIISIITLLVMCVPGVYIFRFARRRWFVYNQQRASSHEILPFATSEHRTLSSSYDNYPNIAPIGNFRTPPRRLGSSPLDDRPFARGGISHHERMYQREVTVSLSSTIIHQE